MCYGATLVPFGHALKCVAGVCIGKGVKQGDTSVELLLNFGTTGNWKGDDAKFFGRSVVVGLLRTRRRGKNEQKREQGPW